MNNYYEILGINKDADDIEIKSAYRTLSQKYHPERYSGSEDATNIRELLFEAHSILSDPQKKYEYDLKINNTRNYSNEFKVNSNYSSENKINSYFKEDQERNFFEDLIALKEMLVHFVVKDMMDIIKIFIFSFVLFILGFYLIKSIFYEVPPISDYLWVMLAEPIFDIFSIFLKY